MAINPDDMKIGLSYMGSDEGGNYTVRNGKKTYTPDFPGTRPPRRPSNPQSTFDNDYSFLNLPQAGSGVRGPIDLPDMSPVDSNFQIDRYAPTDLPNVEMLAPTPQPLTVKESQAVLDSARPFEDSASLGANQKQRFAELGRFFGEKVSGLQGDISELIDIKGQLTKDLEAAFLQQDAMTEQAVQDQIAALDAQRLELVAELETAVAEAESQGVDAVAAAEQVTAEQQEQFEIKQVELESQLQEIQIAQETAIAERDQAVAEQDTIKATAAEEQVQALETLKQELLTEREGIVTELEDKFGVEREGLETDIAALQGNVTNLEGTITDLQGSIDALTVERDDAVAEQDVIRATAADEQVQALEAQKDTLAVDYNQTITDLQAEIDALNTAEVVAETAPVVVDDLPVVTETAPVVTETAPVVTETSEGVMTAPTAEEYMDQLTEPPEKELVRDNYNPNYMGFEDERAIGRQNEADAIANLEAASAAGTASLSDIQAAKNASANLIAQQAFAESGGKTLQQELADLEREKGIQRAVENRPQVTSAAPPFVPITGVDLGIAKPAITSLTPVAPIKSTPIDMSKINIPANYMDQLKNIQLPQNLNFGNLRVGMADGGDINRIEILLRKLR